VKKKLQFTLSSSDAAGIGKQDTLYEILFAGLRSLGHIPKDAHCDALDMWLAFSEGGAEGCKPRAILNPVVIEIEIPLKPPAHHAPNEKDWP